MNDPSRQASAKLLATSHARDKARRLAWGLLVSATVLEALLAVALMDYWLELPRSLRAGGFALLLVLLALGLGGWLKLRRRPTTIKQAALDAEAQRPELGCVVSTAAEYLSGERKITHQYEPELVAALEQQAATKLAKVQVSYSDRLFRPAAFFGFALVTILVFAAAAPVAFTAFKRTVAPWSKDTYTRIAVLPGNLEIPVGRDAVVTNTFTGRIPKNPTLAWRGLNQTSWQSVALRQSEDGLYLHSFKQLQNSVKYRVTANDAVSDTFEITTFVPPEVRELRIHVAYPEYTGVKPFAPDSPNFTALRASDIGFRVTASTKLATARLRFTNAPPVELAEGVANQWTGSFKATKDTDYWIELADAKGHRGGNDKPYHVKVLPDKPPKIDLLEPGQDLRAAPADTIPIKVAATDDFGVSEIKIIYHKLGGPERSLVCMLTNGEASEVIGTTGLALAGLDLKEYELVAYHAEATDNNTLDGPGRAASPVYFIEMTNEEGQKAKGQPRKGERVNLLVIQKQIVADTAALAAQAPTNKFKDLSARQKEAAEFAQIYHDALGEAGAPGEAVQLMADAMQQMNAASGSLGERKRDQAIPPEEKALGDLYQVVKMMPELGNLPTQPPPENQPSPEQKKLRVVLEAIKKQQKEPPSNEEIAEALDEARQLSQAQAAVNQAVERPGHSSPGDSKGGQESGAASPSDSEQQSQQSQAKAKPGEAAETPEANAGEQPGQRQQGPPTKAGDQAGKPGKPANGGDKPGEGKDGQAKTGEQPGQGKSGQNGKGEAKSGQGNGQGELEQLAEMESELSKEAEALAEKLQKLAGKDQRLGHNAGTRASQAADKMAAAAKSLRQGNGKQAGTEGGQSSRHLDSVVAALERVLKDQAKLTDAAAEEAPKEYDALISDYLRKLSHEK